MPGIPQIKLNNGRTMPQFGFGCFAYSEMITNAGFASEFKSAIAAAVDAGYRHFDTAMIYMNEKQVGEALNEAIAAGKAKREDFFVTSKIPTVCMSYEGAKQALDHIHRTLNLGYVDLVLIHFPTAHESCTPEEMFKLTLQTYMTRENEDSSDYVDTWRAMEEAVKDGRVRSIGVSNFNSIQVQRVIDSGTIRPVTNQVECHPSFPQTKLKEFLAERGITLTAYSPLQNPSLHQNKCGNLMEQQCVVDAAKAHNKTPAQVILRWHIQRGNIVIPKSSKPHRIKENIDIFDFKLSDAEMQAIATLDQGKEGRHYAGRGNMVNHKHFPYAADF